MTRSSILARQTRLVIVPVILPQEEGLGQRLDIVARDDGRRDGGLALPLVKDHVGCFGRVPASLEGLDLDVGQRFPFDVPEDGAA